MPKKRIILSAGGTGGHLFPAQVVAEQLSSEYEVLFVAGGLATNRFYNRDRFPFEEISAATFSLGNPVVLLKKSPTILRGIGQSLKLLKKFSPDLVVGFGSFFTFPLLAAALPRYPILLHEQNAIPGKVNRLFSRFAVKTAITFPASASYFRGKTEVVRFPLRPDLDLPPQEADWSYFGLTPGLTTLLVFGGSQGALALNNLFLEAAADLPRPFQVLHFTGNSELTERAKQTYEALGIQACVKDFEREIVRALRIVDLAIARAGAGTVTELIASKTPALLIPYPFAAEDHQVKNAEHFVHEVHGGRFVLEKEVTTARLLDELTSLLRGIEKYRARLEVYEAQREEKDLIILIHDLTSHSKS